MFTYPEIISLLFSCGKNLDTFSLFMAMCFQGGRILSSSEAVRLFSLKAFKWWDEAHPHYGRQSGLRKVYWFNCLSHLKHSFTAISRRVFDQISGCRLNFHAVYLDTNEIKYISWYLVGLPDLDLLSSYPITPNDFCIKIVVSLPITKIKKVDVDTERVGSTRGTIGKDR